jgi:quercetin dioxygenase-like cupin family protein
MQRKRSLAVVAVAVMALLIGAVNMAVASPASGVTPTVLARGTYDAFKVISNPQGPGMFKAESKAPIDMVVRRHEYLAGGSTGWHAHPFPVFVTVISGQVTFYERDDPSCTPVVVSAGQGYVDSGHGHIGRNETNQPAVDVSVIMAPVGAPFRIELDAPGPYCDF